VLVGNKIRHKIDIRQTEANLISTRSDYIKHWQHYLPSPPFFTLLIDPDKTFSQDLPTYLAPELNF